MRSSLTPALALALLLGASASTFAQAPADETVPVQEAAEAADREDRGEWGWIGLLGLLGLLGMRRRERADVAVARRP